MPVPFQLTVDGLQSATSAIAKPALAGRDLTSSRHSRGGSIKLAYQAAACIASVATPTATQALAL